MDRHAAGLEADPDLGQLYGDIIVRRVFHANDGDGVRLTVDDDEARLVGGQGDGGRTARRGERCGAGQAYAETCNKKGTEDNGGPSWHEAPGLPISSIPHPDPALTKTMQIDSPPRGVRCAAWGAGW